MIIIYKDKKGKKMKKLVVYYSLDGNTKLIAETISKEINADILALQYKKERKAKGFMKFILGGKEVMKKIKPELLSFDKNPQDYDLIFIGTPVWAGSYSPPLSTFFSTIKLRDKKAALFCCYGGSEGKTFENMKKALRGSQVLGEIGFRNPLKKDKDQNIQKAKKWANDIIKTI